MKKNILKVISAVLICVSIAIIVSSLLTNLIFRDSKEVSKFLKAEGKDIKLNDKTIVLKGVNAGGFLVQEEWMCPTEMLDQVSLISTLIDRFGENSANELLDAYHKSWWREEDFVNIKNLGFNCIRLPFTYLNLYDENYILKDDAFYLIDWFIENCKENQLYVILDLHGAIGSQNGAHHSGNTWGGTGESRLFSNDDYKEKTIQLWKDVANRYKDEPTIAAYDLLNEPTAGEGFVSGPVQWLFYNDLYLAIREIDSNHIIMMESAWDTKDLPAPKDTYMVWSWNWENVVYQYHHYCWDGVNNATITKEFIDQKIEDIRSLAYEVPIFIGEFTGFELEENWISLLKAYDSEGYSYTMWTYKVVGKNSSWGLYTSDILRVDPSTASYDEILTTWSNLGTSDNFEKNDKICDYATRYIS